jgi:hypothetical protein
VHISCFEMKSAVVNRPLAGAGISSLVETVCHTRVSYKQLTDRMWLICGKEQFGKTLSIVPVIRQIIHENRPSYLPSPFPLHFVSLTQVGPFWFWQLPYR